MDGNLAALNEHLARQEAKDYEHEWKENYIDDCVNAALYQLEVQSYFMHEGVRHDLLDVFTCCSLNTQMGVGDALKMLMFKQGAEVYSNNLLEWATEELGRWVDAEAAYEQHVKDNEPQEP
jgi:hypothetical protein